jgi:AcrR family transcriptional regulator
MSSQISATAEKSSKPAKAELPPPRERILAAARELFHLQGIRAVSVDAVAEAAGTNKMTLYRHFESKDALVAEYIRQFGLEWERQWRDIVAANPKNPEAQLEAWIDEVDRCLQEGGGRGCPIANAAVEFPEKDHPARVIIERLKAEQRRHVGDLLRSAGYADPEHLADGIALLFEGARIDSQCGGPCRQTRLAHMIRTLIKSQPKK